MNALNEDLLGKVIVRKAQGSGESFTELLAVCIGGPGCLKDIPGRGAIHARGLQRGELRTFDSVEGVERLATEEDLICVPLDPESTRPLSHVERAAMRRAVENQQQQGGASQC